MKTFLPVLLLLSLPVSASAKMYKCTDDDGNVSFTDKPCKEQKQEELKIRSSNTSSSSSSPSPEGDEESDNG